VRGSVFSVAFFVSFPSGEEVRARFEGGEEISAVERPLSVDDVD